MNQYMLKDNRTVERGRERGEREGERGREKRREEGSERERGGGRERDSVLCKTIIDAKMFDTLNIILYIIILSLTEP